MQKQAHSIHVPIVRKYFNSQEYPHQSMNITEKILARASKKSSVSPDDVIFADIDCAMVHDVSGPGVIKVFEKLEKQGIDTSKLWNPDKIWVAEDHFVPSAEKTSAANVAKLEKFVKKYNISKHFKYGLGQYGICHTLSHEEGLVSPGQVYVGGDSHTNTTGALGAFACGLGHTDMAYVMLYWPRPYLKCFEMLYFFTNFSSFATLAADVFFQQTVRNDLQRPISCLDSRVWRCQCLVFQVSQRP